MSEQSKVRLVRCPKCRNLLPEVTGYSVYECGGCGAVLTAQNKQSDLDTFSQKSEEERVEGVSEKLHERFDTLGKRTMDLSDGSGNDVNSNYSSSSRAESRRTLRGRTENNRNSWLTRADKWASEDDGELYKNSNEISHAVVAKENEDKPYNGNESGTRRSGRIPDWVVGETSMLRYPRAPRTGVDDMRYSAANYPDEGPSGYESGSSYGYRGPPRNRHGMDVFNRVEDLGDDRAELLRKLDELRDQLSRSCEVTDKSKEKFPGNARMDPYVGSDNCLFDNSLMANRPSMQYSLHDEHVARPLRMNHYAEPSRFVNRNETTAHSFYPLAGPSSHIQGAGDPLWSQMPRTGQYQVSAPSQKRPPHAYCSSEYMDNDTIPVDPFDQHPSHVNHHHPSCSCFYCYNKNHVPARGLPTTYGEKRFSDVASDPRLYSEENTSTYDARDYNSRFANPPPLRSHSPQPLQGLPGDLNAEVGGFIRRRPPRVQPMTSGQICWPIAGGAPFVTCCNCFELLQLPKKFLLRDKKEKKLRCGGCSTIIKLTAVNKKLFLSVYVEVKPTMDDLNTKSIEGSSFPRGRQIQDSTDFSSDDYDNSGFVFHPMDREVGSTSTAQRSYNKSADMRSHHSTSSYMSEDEEKPVNLIAPLENSNSSEQPTNTKPTPPPAGSPLQDYFDYSNVYNSASHLGNGNRSESLEPDKIIQKKTTSRQSSLKDVSEATEIDISSNEFCNTGTSLESGEASREGDRLKSNKAAESFFGGIIKKSFRDLSRSNHSDEQEIGNVTVNGHLIPARSIRKAAKLAGPIHPGNYWYDFRAGFWGVIGSPCLGIIPPFIEEFNYPMPENCAGGNTSVFVNGRELNKKDLNLLASRGLSSERNKSYIVEISGRVLDQDTGEELESLGKLAPTVERMKHGFGMKVPKAAA